MGTIFLAEGDEAIRRCYAVMAELRPHLTEGEFPGRVQKQRESGYQLAAVEQENRVVAVAGFRFLENLAWGKFLYVDDLVSESRARGKGHGHALIQYLIALARKENCHEFHLDSGVQRFGAHRFYLRQGLDITCHHFALKL